MADKYADHAPASWQLQDAKARFSELVKGAREQVRSMSVSEESRPLS
jgi:hypothetical protein